MVKICTKASVLHTKAKPVVESEVAEICRDNLLQAFYDLDCKAQGLAAIQINLHYAAFLVRYKKGKDPKIIFNPVLLKSYGSKRKLEGCLSEPGIWYRIKRPLLIKVSYQDENFIEHTEWLTYKKARIFMHELDHLNGIMLQDKNEIGVKL